MFSGAVATGDARYHIAIDIIIIMGGHSLAWSRPCPPTPTSFNIASSKMRLSAHVRTENPRTFAKNVVPSALRPTAVQSGSTWATHDLASDVPNPTRVSTFSC